MRLKASYRQRVLMLAFMVGVCLWAAWPNQKLMLLVAMGGIAVGLYLLLPRRRR
jgi:hypothetical protein